MMKRKADKNNNGYFNSIPYVETLSHRRRLKRHKLNFQRWKLLSDMNTSLDRLKSRLDIAKDKVSERKHIVIDTKQNETTTTKKQKGIGH